MISLQKSIKRLAAGVLRLHVAHLDLQPALKFRLARSLAFQDSRECAAARNEQGKPGRSKGMRSFQDSRECAARSCCSTILRILCQGDEEVITDCDIDSAGAYLSYYAEPTEPEEDAVALLCVNPTGKSSPNSSHPDLHFTDLLFQGVHVFLSPGQVCGMGPISGDQMECHHPYPYW